MTVQERIKQFGERNAPFYICDHQNGEYSLCLPLDFLSGDYEDFCQEAFNRYAVEIGEPAIMLSVKLKIDAPVTLKQCGQKHPANRQAHCWLCIPHIDGNGRPPMQIKTQAAR